MSSITPFRPKGHSISSSSQEINSIASSGKGKLKRHKSSKSSTEFDRFRRKDTVNALKSLLFDKITVLSTRMNFLEGQEVGSAIFRQGKNANVYTLLIKTNDKNEKIKKLSIEVLGTGGLNVQGHNFHSLDKFLQKTRLDKDKILTKGDVTESTKIMKQAMKDLKNAPEVSVVEYSRKTKSFKNWQASTWIAVKNQENKITLHKVLHGKDKKKLNLENVPSPKSRFVATGGEKVLKELHSESGNKLLRGKLFNEAKFSNMERKVYEKFKDSPNLLIPLLYKKGESERFVIERKGSDLLALTMKEGSPPLTERQVLGLFSHVLLGIKEMHDQNTAHLDAKPDNVLVEYDPNKPEKYSVHWIDFGKTHIFDNPNQIVFSRGTPGYFDPFLAMMGIKGVNEAKAADIYGLGMCLITMLAKEPLERIILSPKDRLMDSLGLLVYGGEEGASTSQIMPILNKFLAGEINPRIKIDAPMLELIALMISQPAKNRPTIDEVIQKVNVLINKMDQQTPSTSS